MKRSIFKVLGALTLTAGWSLLACGGATISFSGQNADDSSIGRGDCPVGTLRPVQEFHYEVTRGGQVIQLQSMRDNLQQGDHVEAVFSIADRCSNVQLTLASYTAPSADNGTELQQHLFDSDTGTFGAGQHRLQIDVPNCFYQTDFAYGPVIDDVRDEGTYGARNVDSDVGGTTACNGSETASSSSSSSSGATSSSSSSGGGGTSTSSSSSGGGGTSTSSSSSGGGGGTSSSDDHGNGGSSSSSNDDNNGGGSSSADDGSGSSEDR